MPTLTNSRYCCCAGNRFAPESSRCAKTPAQKPVPPSTGNLLHFQFEVVALPLTRGIEHGVAAKLQEMRFLLYQDRLEPALKQMPNPGCEEWCNDWSRLMERFERSETIEQLERLEQQTLETARGRRR